MELWYTEEHTDNVRFGIKIKEHLYHGQSDFQQVDVMDTYEFGKILTLDGLMMVTEKDEFVYHEMIAHVPMAANPEIKDVLVIGGGDGGTVRELVRYETINKIDMVEIDGDVVEVSKKFLDYTAKSMDHEKVNLMIADGIEFIKDKKNCYDLIIVDSTDPIGPGEGLFSTEFYTNCYEALRENGILVNQNESPYYENNAREMKRSHSKIRNLFSVSKLYQFHMPTYPSGHWMFGFASKGIDPIENDNIEKWNDLGLSTRYYNTDIHRGAFCLPNFVKELIAHADEY